MNPPYGRKIGLFIERAIELANQYKCLLVMLLPARVDTRWFERLWDRNLSQPKPGFKINFVKGRLIFELEGKPILNNKTGKPSGALFPSMIVEYKSNI
jgi:hypothetical protein